MYDRFIAEYHIWLDTSLILSLIKHRNIEFNDVLQAVTIEIVSRLLLTISDFKGSQTLGVVTR